MSFLSVGDMARTFQVQRFSTDLRRDLTRLGNELSSGQKSDLANAVSGDFMAIAEIERGLASLSAYRTANIETAQLFETAQITLESVQSMARELSPQLLTTSESRNGAMIQATSEDARQKFEAAIAQFNTVSGGRSVFAGVATDRPALSDGETIMNSLKTAVAGATTANGVVAAVDAWFDTPGGGFSTTGYSGSANSIESLAIAEGEHVDFQVRADDEIVRNMLKGFALGGLVSEGVLSGNFEEQAAVLDEAAKQMIGNDDDVTNLRAEIGTIENRIDNARARNAAHASSLKLARTELIAVDPYETATELEAVRTQLETLYTVTTRIANLRFADFMR